MIKAEEIARIIDHTLLKPDATPEQVRQVCEEAKTYQFASVVVNPVYARFVAQQMQGSNVKVCVVIGFPLGANLTQVKVYETEQALNDGATEVDMVINIGALKSKDNELVERDIAGVVQMAHSRKALVKVIIETALLTEEEKVRACQIAQKAGAHFVKTSTGFSSGGATVEDITLMRRVVGPNIGVKASGGIKTLADAQSMIAAGATRLGASAGVKIVQEAKSL